jgi:hypothetical protein
MVAAGLLIALCAAAPASAAVPVVTTGVASEVMASSMKVCGTVNPEGESTTYHFNYEHYENGWQLEKSAPASAGAGTAANEVCVALSGLMPQTKYWYRIVAENGSGESLGEELSQQTPAAVEGLATEPPTNLTRLGATSSVTLNGVLAPNGHDTHYYFEYAKGIYVPVKGVKNEIAPALPGGDAGEESKLVHVSATVEIPTNVEFSYMLVGVNQFGATYGSEQRVFVPAVEGVQTLSPTELTASSAVLNGTLEPNGFDAHWQFVCVAPEAAAPSVAADAGSASGPVAVNARLTQLSNGDPLEGNTKMSCSLVASDSLGSNEGALVKFTTPAAAPLIENGAQPGVTTTTAGVHSNIQTENEPTALWVEYVDAAGYDATAANPYEAGGKTVAAHLEATPYVVRNATRGIVGLSAATAYHYRFVAENATGVTYGSDVTFTTAPLSPPMVTTGAASGVSATGGTISGTVNPESLKTSYEFQIGETSSYGGAEIFGDAGEAGGDEAVSTTLSYLVPGMTYHYRLLATNADGTTYGPDMVFTTPNVPSPIGQPVPTPLLAFAPAVFPVEPKTPATQPRHKVKAKTKGKSKAKHKKKAVGKKQGKKAVRKGQRKKKK